MKIILLSLLAAATANAYTAGDALVTVRNASNTGQTLATVAKTNNSIIGWDASGNLAPVPLGSNVSPFLSSATSANLAAALTNETGTGSAVFSNSPSLVTPALGSPTSGNFSSGFFTWPTFNQDTSGRAGTVTTNANLTGDVTSVGNASTVVKINGTSLSGLATGILKNTTSTGVPSIAVAADFPTLNQSTSGNAATVTTNANLTGVVTSTGNVTSIANNALSIAQVSTLQAALDARALLSPSETFSPTVLALVAAHHTANANADPAALLAWARCLTELETGGILGNLKEGVCFRSSYNSSTSYIGIKNTVATIAGTVPATPDGALFLASSANYIKLAVTDSRVFTAGIDFRMAADAPSGTALLELTTANGSNQNASMLVTDASLSDQAAIYTSGAVGTFGAAFSDVIGNNGDAYTISRYNPCDTIASFSSDNAVAPTIKIAVNGVLKVTDTTGNYQAGTAATNVVIGARFTNGTNYDLPMKGSIAAMVLMDKVLSDAENVTLAKAIRHLDPRKINIVTNGDSRTAQISDSTHRTGSWPYQMVNSPALNRKARLCNIAVNGSTAASASASFSERTNHLKPNGTSILFADYYVWFGANDVIASYTGAQIWATVSSMCRSARALGMRSIVMADPEGGTTYTGPQEAARQAYNVLVRAGYNEWDSMADLDAALGSTRDSRWWLNDLHPNNAGNAKIADWLTRGGTGRFTLDGGIVNADVSTGAAIAYSKLALTGAVTNADLAGSIAYSKLALTGAVTNADLAGSISLTTKVTGVLQQVNGGTGLSSLPVVAAYPSADQTFTAGAENQMLFQTEEEDTGNCFASSTFTAPAAGHVRIGFSWYKSSGSAGIDAVKIYKNGSSSLFPFSQAVGPADVNCISVEIKVAASDTLKIYYSPQNAATIGGIQALTRCTYTFLP